MKLFAILTAAILSAGCAAAQDTSPPLVVGGVHDVSGLTQREICNRARDWVALTFRDSKAVIEVFDAEQGKLIGKGAAVIHGYAATPFTIRFTLMIECKDGRARSTFSSFTAISQYGEYELKEDSLNHLKTKTDAHIRDLTSQLVAHLNQAKSDKW